MLEHWVVELMQALGLGERMLREGAETVRELDGRSLAWRGKAPKPRPAESSPARDEAGPASAAGPLGGGA